MSQFYENIRRVKFSDPLYTTFYFINDEDRRSTNLANLQHFKFKIQNYRTLIAASLHNKIQHMNTCPLLDHTSCVNTTS